jgi:uncharacterized protein with ATP-grasp and redox domains
MERKVREAEETLTMAVRYAMVGNYIDFGAMESVDENVLRAQLDQAADMEQRLKNRGYTTFLTIV